MARLIEAEEENVMNRHEEGKSSFSYRLSKYIKFTHLDDYLHYINFVLSILMAILHCVDTSRYFHD
jgi:hypothetical protein